MDIVQTNGSICLVISVNDSCARIRPMTEKIVRIKTRFDKETEFVAPGAIIAISAHVDRYLVIGKATDAQWQQYNKQPKKEDKMIQLEVGDQLMHGGELRTVISVTEKKAVLGNLAGQEFSEKRKVNELLFTDSATNVLCRFNEEQRAKHITDFLAARKAPPAGEEQTKQISGAEQNEDSMSSKKNATKKNGKSNGKPAAKATNGEARRKDLIWSLLDGKLTKDQIADKVLAKFPGDRETVLKRINDAPFYMRKAGLKPAWKEKESAAEKPAKKTAAAKKD